MGNKKRVVVYLNEDTHTALSEYAPTHREKFPSRSQAAEHLLSLVLHIHHAGWLDPEDSRELERELIERKQASIGRMAGLAEPDAPPHHLPPGAVSPQDSYAQ